MKNIKIYLIMMVLGCCSLGLQAQTNVTITDENVTVESYSNSTVTVEGKSNLSLTSATPLVNSTINLVGENAWLYFTSIKPSKVVDEWSKYVKIDGRAFNKNKDRVAIHTSGAVIIPNGLDIAKKALTVYTGKNFTGESRSFEIYTYHSDLGKFDNKVRSFKLKKGFSATLANNSDGRGFSRYFIASDEDIEFSEMPEGLEFVSFIRVFKWDWSSKKGWAGGPSEQLNVNIFNTWGGGSDPNPDMQFVPMRHNLGWDAWEVINAQKEVSQLLGYNEPDRPDQSNMTVEDAIAQWPEFFKSGLRLGSPAPASTNGNNWLRNFMNICDMLNYRVDFMVTHAYQNQNVDWWKWYIDLTSRGNRSVDEAGGIHRPVWVTEWNNGANWTTESWPTASGPKRDADLNIIYDDNGDEIIINRPLSPENSARSVAKMQEVLPGFENIDLFEHHYLYNWVQDARSMELDGKLTPAGKYFADFKSKIGFQKKNEYIHKWKIAPPWLVNELSEDYKKINLWWYDHNGETGKRYILQHRVDDGDWTLLKAYVAGEDYNFGDTIKFEQSILPIEFNKVEYRVYAVSYKDIRSVNSYTVTFKHDAVPGAPTGLNGEAVSSTILKLKWDTGANARSYRLERSTSADGVYETIANLFVDKEFVDKELHENTNYFYRVYSINSRGESVASTPFQLKTKQLVIPAKPTNLRAASGDRIVTLTWDFVHDAIYNIYRANSATGEYALIASNLEVIEGDARYKDTGLEYNQTYYYKVVPSNGAGIGPDSEIVSAVSGMRQYMHLTFKENEGTTVYDEWGGYHAEFQAAPKWNVGREEKSAVFLATADKSHLLLPEGVVADLKEEFTIASWLYLPENAGNNTRMFDFGSGTGTFMVFIPKYNNSGQARYKLTYAKDGVQYAFQPTFAYNFPLGGWAHVAFTVQEHPQGGLFFMAYLNGELVASDRDLNSLNPSEMGVTKANYLGRSQWPADPYSSHGYDDFRIYNQALTRTDIRNLYEGKALTGLKPSDPSDIYYGISDEELVSVAPNPVYAGQSVTVTVSGINEINSGSTVRIFSLMGKLIAQYELDESNAVIPAPSMAGTYLVNISSGGFNKVAKLIVK